MDALERDFYEERRRKWRRSAFWRGFLVAAVLAAIIGAWLGSGAIDRRAAADRPLRGQRHHHRRPRPRRAAAGARRQRQRARGGRADQLARRHHGRVGGALRLAAADRRRRSRWWPSSARSRPRAATSRRSRPTISSARGNTLTGSIGVIMEYPDLTQVMDRLGIEPGDGALVRAQGRALAVPADEPGGTGASTRRWSPRATAGSAASSASAAASKAPALDAVANGGVFTGRLALENGLIDEIGGEPEALAWLEFARRRPRRPAGARLGGRAREDAGWSVPRQDWAQPAGFSGKYRSRPAPKLYSIGP